MRVVSEFLWLQNLCNKNNEKYAARQVVFQDVSYRTDEVFTKWWCDSKQAREELGRQGFMYEKNFRLW